MATTDSTAAERMASYFANLTLDDLPDEVVRHVKRVLLDFLGAAVAGAALPTSRAIQELVLEEGCKGTVTILGTGIQASSGNAILANGTAAAATELDDGHFAARVHPGATCIPAILAIAEQRNLSKRQVAVAITVAYEVSCRLGAVCYPRISGRGFHTSPVVGAFGAAAGVASALGSSESVFAHALGLAGTNAGGLNNSYGGWLDSFAVQLGRVGREGAFCASLAHRGVKGPVDVLEAEHGFANALLGAKIDVDHLVGRLGTNWKFLDTYVKPYPCCRYIHPVIDAILSMQERDALNAEDINEIKVETNSGAAKLNAKRWKTMAEAQLSIPYSVAISLIFGIPRLHHFTQEQFVDDRVKRLAALTVVVAADEFEQPDRPIQGAIVTICAGGAEFKKRVSTPWGERDNPVCDTDLEDRFKKLVACEIGTARALDAIEEIQSLETDRPIQKLITLLQKKP